MKNIKEIMATHPNTSITLEVSPFSDALCKITASVVIDERVSKLDILSAQTPEAVDDGNQRAISQLLAILGFGEPVPETPASAPEDEEPVRPVKRRGRKGHVKAEAEQTEPHAETVPTEPEPAESTVEPEEPHDASTPVSDESSFEGEAESEPVAIENPPEAEQAQQEETSVDVKASEEATAPVPESSEELEAKREQAKSVLVEILPGAEVSARMKSFVGKTVWEMVREKRSFGPLLLAKAKKGDHILSPEAEEALNIIVDMLKE